MKTLCNLEIIKKMGIIDKNLVNNITEQVLYMIEAQVLQPVLSKKLYEQLMLQKENGQYLEQYQYLLDNFIIYAVAHRLKAELMVDTTFELKRAGVSQNALEKTNTISLKDVKELMNMSITTSNWWLEQMVSYIECNCGMYPEYKVIEQCCDEIPSRDKIKVPFVL